jgi:hypothetical protein
MFMPSAEKIFLAPAQKNPYLCARPKLKKMK